MKEPNNKNRAELNEIENRKTIEKIYATKSWFFSIANKIGKPLARLSKEKTKITQTKSEIKKKKSQWTPQKYKGLYENTTKD